MSRTSPDMGKIMQFGEPSNPASDTLAQASAAGDASEVLVRESFAVMLIDDKHLQLVTQHRNNILRFYSKARQETLRIGESLIELKETVPGYVFAHVLDSGILPFQRRWAEKVMDVVWARPRFKAALGQAYDQNNLPSIQISYELCKLTDKDLKEAASKGLLQGTSRPEDFAIFKEQIAESRVVEVKPGAAAIRRLHQMERELAKVETRASYLRNQIAKLERVINQDDIMTV